MTKIILDAMGGDDAPVSIVEGGLLALKEIDVSLVFVGDESAIRELLSRHDYDESRVEIVHASENISNEESPVMAIRRKKDSSIVKAMKLLKDGEGDAFVSAGSTGAVLAGGTFILGRIEGVLRPALGVFFPNEKGVSLFLDCGANVDSKPEYLVQFAKMGAAYYESTVGTANPTVGLINNGSEAKKGNALTKATYKLLEADEGVNFTGNVEGREIPDGVADVYVCDGFVGNIVLKMYEGLAASFFGMLKDAIMKNLVSKMGGLLIKGSMMDLKKSLDYSEYGGAPLLGLNKLVMKCHGSSNAKAIKYAIIQAAKFTDNKVNEKIRTSIAQDFTE